MRSTKRYALSRTDVIALAVVAMIVVLLASTIWPDIGSRPLSRRLVCGSNVKNIGTSATIYSNEFSTWPIPAFDESSGVDYRVPVGGGRGTAQSPDRSQQSQSGPGGASQLSLSRALWMFVRNGDVTVKQLVCPESGDSEDPTDKLENYYDFSSPTNLSYGLQVPFGAAFSRPRDGADNRVVFAADKGPFRNAHAPGPPPGLPLEPTEPWKPFNSPNHSQEGQIVLFADGHSSFMRVPAAGVDQDNIYTIALDNYNQPSPTIGENPWIRGLPPQSNTDSVIFP